MTLEEVEYLRLRRRKCRSIGSNQLDKLPREGLHLFPVGLWSAERGTKTFENAGLLPCLKVGFDWCAADVPCSPHRVPECDVQVRPGAHDESAPKQSYGQSAGRDETLGESVRVLSNG
jgi:hypothetical protein